jgi:acetolactate synthase I/III small subunit
VAGKKNKHIIIVQLEDEPGALNRVVSMFRRRGYNIDSLSVSGTEEPNLSRMTLTVEGEDEILEQITKQLYKVVEVVKVNDVTAESSIVRELMLIRVTADKPEARTEIMQFAEIFKARVLDVATDSITIEATGQTEDNDRLLSLLRKFGVKESVRTGNVAMVRGSSAVSAI